MKINKVHFEDHPFFGTLDIDFSGSDGSRPLKKILKYPPGNVTKYWCRKKNTRI